MTLPQFYHETVNLVTSCDDNFVSIYEDDVLLWQYRRKDNYREPKRKHFKMHKLFQEILKFFFKVTVYISF